MTLAANLGWTAHQTSELAFGILAISGAIVCGYVVSCLVPEPHYPRAFGVIAANVVLAGLAAFGVSAIAHADLLMWFMIASAGVVAGISIFKDDD